MALNAATIGRRYRTSAEFVRLEAISDYAAATNDLNPRYEGAAPAAIAPPLLPVRLLWDVCKKVVFDPEVGVDMLRLVHGEQDMVFHDVLRPWDLVAARATVLAVDRKASGEVLTVGQRLMRDGECVTEVKSAYFIRGDSPQGEARPVAVPPARTYLFERAFDIDADQPHRYAAASLDGNPIHTDPAVAKAAGLPGIILHGVCTMALTGREVVNALCAGEPRRLRRLKVRFSRMVLPGDVLTTRAWEVDEVDGCRTVGVETVNQRGELVLSNGLAELRTC